MAQFRTSRLFDIIFVAALGVLLWWAAVNRVAVGDWVYFMHYHPSAKTVQVAAAAGLSPAGQRLFYRTDPQFVPHSVVDQACSVENLGCIDPKGRVYILDESNQPNRTVVTAAHEMLHLAYRRLSNQAKQDLAPLLDQGIAMNSTDIASELTGLTTADDRRDEAHSLLGSEYRDLPPALERYYSQYFSDRSKVVQAEAASEQEAR